MIFVGFPRFLQSRRGQERPGQPRRAQQSPGGPRRGQDSPGEPRPRIWPKLCQNYDKYERNIKKHMKKCETNVAGGWRHIFLGTQNHPGQTATIFAASQKCHGQASQFSLPPKLPAADLEAKVSPRGRLGRWAEKGRALVRPCQESASGGPTELQAPPSQLQGQQSWVAWGCSRSSRSAPGVRPLGVLP